MKCKEKIKEKKENKSTKINEENKNIELKNKITENTNKEPKEPNTIITGKSNTIIDKKPKEENEESRIDKKLKEEKKNYINEKSKIEEKEEIKNSKESNKEIIKKEIKEDLNNKINDKFGKQINENSKKEIKEKNIQNTEEKKENKNKEPIKENIKIEDNELKNNLNETEDQTYDISENIYETEDISYDIIDNNIEANVGTEQLIVENKDKKSNKEIVKIRKELLRTVNSFIACLGPPGSGKSTFCSNYYKKIYKVKNNFFEPSEEYESFTKGIWIVSEAERRKIPIAIKKDLLDVEGFQADLSKCWKYVMIIAFLSTELLILNRDARYDNVKKVLTIIANSLNKMKKGKIPRILKTIYIQTVLKKPKLTIEEMLDKFHIDKNAFNTINFEYVYLPNISEEQLEGYRL